MATPVNFCPDYEEMQAVAALFAIQKEAKIFEDNIKAGKVYNAKVEISDTGKQTRDETMSERKQNEITQFAKIQRHKTTGEASESYIPRPSTRHPRTCAARAPASYQELDKTEEFRIMDEKASSSSLKKYKPKKKPGDKVIAEGVDRNMAVVREVDETMLTITFEVERKDKYGHVTRGQKVTYGYLENHAAPDWNSTEDVRAVNIWRRHIFGRSLPPVRKPRELWLQSEKDLVLNILRDDFEKRGYVRWNALANTFNRKMAMAKVVQRAGETFVSSGLRKADALKKDRAAPWRSRQAIMGQCTSRWPEYRELLDRYQLAENDEGDLDGDDGVPDSIEKSPEPDSGDEDEIPDPNPHPLPETTHRHINEPTASGAKTFTSQGRKRTYNEIEQNTDTGEKSGKETEEKMVAKKLELV